LLGLLYDHVDIDIKLVYDYNGGTRNDLFAWHKAWQGFFGYADDSWESVVCDFMWVRVIYDTIWLGHQSFLSIKSHIAL
jgi:hypothetical protein